MRLIITLTFVFILALLVIPYHIDDVDHLPDADDKYIQPSPIYDSRGDELLYDSLTINTSHHEKSKER